MKWSASWLAASWLGLPCLPVSAQVTQRVNVDSSGVWRGGVGGLGEYLPSLSADGRYVVFQSEAPLVVGAPGDTSYIFVRDRLGGTTELASVDSSGLAANNECYQPSISADGRFVAFWTYADNLVPGDTNLSIDVFVHDRQSGTTERASVSTSGTQGDGDSWFPSISADGRYVVFVSNATNLVPGAGGNRFDVFVRDRQNGTTELVSVDRCGSAASGGRSTISADGRYVAFSSVGSNLAGNCPSDGEGCSSDRVDTTNGGCNSTPPAYSAIAVGDDVVGTVAWDLMYRDTDWYRFHIAQPATVYWSVGAEFSADVALLADGCPASIIASGSGTSVTVSAALAPGTYSAFVAPAFGNPPIVCGASNDYVGRLTSDTTGTGGWNQVYVSDRQFGRTELVSVSTSGSAGNHDSSPYLPPSISPDGRYVAFASLATNLVSGDTNGASDVFVHDRQSGTTERVSVDSSGVQGNDSSGQPSDSLLSISLDGRYVAFVSRASNLVAGDTNGFSDAFVRDRQSHTTERVSVSSDGVQGNQGGESSSMSSDGRYVVFGSRSSNLVPTDSDTSLDVFVRDRFGGTTFTSLCDPGVGGVTTCACGNAPSGLGRGCDNSSATGGAVLSASGGTYLSSDSLVFTTSGEKPTALSIVTQWSGTNATGVSFGQGVRCTSGTFKRLYTKSASGGSITAPDWGAGDLQVSVRSAALGDALAVGQSRWYFVYYRDPIVRGGCPASSTFNCTQTGQVTWAP